MSIRYREVESSLKLPTESYYELQEGITVGQETHFEKQGSFFEASGRLYEASGSKSEAQGRHSEASGSNNEVLQKQFLMLFCHFLKKQRVGIMVIKLK